jgi:hypothetical protein
MVEVTVRTVQGRPLLTPSAEVNQIILGALARAQELYPLEINSFAFLSGHYHLGLWVKDAQQLAKFMCHFNSNLAREVCRLRGWSDKVWSRRYSAIVVSDEPAAQRERFAYIVSQSVKEGLVAAVEEWPGVHVVHHLVGDRPAEGLWFDRTQECSARCRGESFERHRFATRLTVTLSPLPCWRHLSPEAQRERVAEVVAEVEAEAATQRNAMGRSPLGADAILSQDPIKRPDHVKTTPAPLFHAASRRVRRELRDAYYAFVAAYREAAEKLRAGIRDVIFPAGSFPPALPFVESG